MLLSIKRHGEGNNDKINFDSKAFVSYVSVLISNVIVVVCDYFIHNAYLCCSRQLKTIKGHFAAINVIWQM
jgi:hypothetical protein